MSFFSVYDFMSVHLEDVPPEKQHEHIFELWLEEAENNTVEYYLCRPFSDFDTVARAKLRAIVFRIALRMILNGGGAYLTDAEEIELAPFKVKGIISLDLFKAHIGSDELIDGAALGGLNTSTDALLQLYIDAAEARAAAMLGKPLTDFDPMPADIRGAILMLAAHFYANRETVLVGARADEIPYGVADTLRNYRVEVTGYVRP